jgi:hypothetical protein
MVLSFSDMMRPNTATKSFWMGLAPAAETKCSAQTYASFRNSMASVPPFYQDEADGGVDPGGLRYGPGRSGIDS